MAEVNTLPVTRPGAQPGARVDPFRSYNFKLIIDGVAEGHFAQLEALQTKPNVIHPREGGDGTVVRQQPEPRHLRQATLSRGFATSSELWNWFLDSMSGQPRPKNVSIVMLGMDGMTEMLRYNLLACWPCDWEVAAFDALSNQADISRLILTFESLSRG